LTALSFPTFSRRVGGDVGEPEHAVNDVHVRVVGNADLRVVSGPGHQFHLRVAAPDHNPPGACLDDVQVKASARPAGR